MPTATVSYRGELKDLQARLAQVTDITRAEARKMVKDLDRSMRAVEKAQNRAASSAGVYSKSIATAASRSTSLAQAGQSIAMQLPDVASQLAAGTPPAQVFAQQGLQVVQQNMHSLMGVMARFAPAMGLLGVAVAAGAAAYVILSRDLERAEAGMVAAAKAATAAQVAHAGLERSIVEVDDALAKANGTYDNLSAAHLQRVSDINEAIAVERRAVNAAYDRVKAEHQAALAQKEAATTGFLRHNANKEIARTTEALAAAEARREQHLGALAAREADLVARSGQAVVAAREREAQEERLRKAEAARSAAARQAERDALEVERRIQEAMRLRAAASEELARVEQAASLAVLDPQARLTEEYRRQMVAIGELQAASGDYAAAEAARAAVREEYELRTWELRRDRAEQFADEEKRRQEEIAQAEQQRIQQREQAERALYSSLGSLAGTSANALAGYANQVAESNVEAAKTAWAAYKGISIASAIVSGAAGAARALADYPYPFSLGVAALVAAEAAIQVGVIAGQEATFADTPGLVRAGSRGMTANVAPGDLLVAGRDEGDLVRQMQRAGIGMGGGSEVLVRDVDRHHGRYGRDPLRPPGTYRPLRSRAGRTPGRR